MSSHKRKPQSIHNKNIQWKDFVIQPTESIKLICDEESSSGDPYYSEEVYTFDWPKMAGKFSEFSFDLRTSVGALVIHVPNNFYKETMKDLLENWIGDDDDDDDDGDKFIRASLWKKASTTFINVRNVDEIDRNNMTWFYDFKKREVTITLKRFARK